MKIADKVFPIVEPTVASMGYELYEVEFQKEYDNWVLTLYIDGPNGISLDDCEAVSRAVDPVLDEADPIEQPYYLSVSSIGLDRPIRTDKDFARNVGNKIDIKLYAPINKKKEFVGELIGFDAESFTASVDGAEMKIERKKAALVRPHIDF